MEHLIAYILSIIITYISNFIVAFRAMKLIMDCGYKFNFKRINEFSELINPNLEKMQKIVVFCPVVNILYSLSLHIKVSNQAFLLPDAFRVMDLIQPMTNEEMREYSKNPTFLNAINIIANSIEKDDLEIYTSVDDKQIDITKINEDESINSLNTIKEKQLSITDQKKYLQNLKESLKENTEKENLKLSKVKRK